MSQKLGERSERVVALGMPELIIDLLQAVQIEIEKRSRLLQASRQFERVA